MLQTKLKELRDALVNMSDVKVYHYWRPRLKAPFIIWQEDGADSSVSSNNKVIGQSVHGTLDFYTKDEYDETFDLIQETLNDLEGFSWRWDSTQYEDETGLTHYSWDWWTHYGDFESG